MNKLANMIDGAIATVAPVIAARRARARVVLSMSGSYTGARHDQPSLMDWWTTSGSADSDTIPDLPTLRSRSRDLVRNSPLAGGAINTEVTHVVGEGLRLMPSIDFKSLGIDEETANEWEDQAARLWRLWSSTPECDITRTLNFDGLTELAFRSTLENGDCFALQRFVTRPGSPFGLKCQLIEADRCADPTGIGGFNTIAPGAVDRQGGIEVDKSTGAPIAYWFSDRHPGDSWGRGLRFERVPAFGPRSGRRQVLHLYEVRRIGQRRGVPKLAPVISVIKQLTRYTDAEIMAAVVNSCFAITMKTENPDGDNLPVDGEDDQGKPISLTRPGQVVGLGVNESIEGFTPDRPNGGFDPFVQAMLRQIGVALEIPFEVLIKHFTASYSAARAALLEAFRFFRKRRRWVATYFCQPFYESFLTETVAAGMLRAPGFFEDPLLRQAWSGAKWIGPGMGQIMPQQETAASKDRIDAGLSTIEEETAQLNGGDFEHNHRQRAREKRMRVEAGLEAAAGAPAGSAVPPAPAPANQDRSDREDSDNAE